MALTPEQIETLKTAYYMANSQVKMLEKSPYQYKSTFGEDPEKTAAILKEKLEKEGVTL